MGGIKDITIKLSGDAAGLASAFKVAGREAGKFQGDMEQFAKQYRSTMAAAFDKGAADRMAQNLFGSIEGMKNRLLAQAKQLKGMFSDASIVGVQGKFKAAGANEFGIKDGTSAAVNMAAATGQSIDKVGALLAKSLQGAGKELSKLVPEVAKLTAEELKAGAAIDIVAKKYEGFGDKANAAFKRAEFTSKLKDMGDKMSSMGRNMSLYLTTPLVAAGGGAIKYASDVNESINKVDVAFGKHGEYVKRFADGSIKMYGISKGSALDMSATYGDMATSMGLSTAQAAKMSTVLVGLAGDMSSFKNIPIAETSQALTAIFTGETESLKRMGVVMTEANLQAFALSKGIKTKVQAMSESDKVMLRYQYILEKTKNSQGDFARTADSTANQQRMLGESVKQLAAKFGEVLLPVFTKILGYVNKLVEWLSGLSSTTKTIIAIVAGLVAVVGPLLTMLGMFISTVLPALIAGATAIGGAWLPIIAVVTGLASAFALFNKETKKTAATTNDLVDSKYFKPMLDEKKGNLSRIRQLKKDHNISDGMLNTASLSKDESVQWVIDEISKLTERNKLIDEAIKKKKEQQAEEARYQETLNANISLSNINTEKAKESIGDVYKKFAEAKQALDNQLKNGVVTGRGYYSELESLASQYYKKIGEFSNAAKTKELATVKAYVEKAREMMQVSATEITSPYGASSAGTLKPSDKALKSDKWVSGNMVVGTANMTSSIDKAKTGIAEMQQLMQAFVQGVQDSIASTLEGIGTMFGELARGGGSASLKKFLSGFVSMIGDFAIQMGKMLLAIGIAESAFYKSLSSGPQGAAIAMAAGAALIIAGAAFKSFVSAGPSGGSSGNSSSTYIGRTTPSGKAATASTSASQVSVVGELKLQMGELKAALRTIDKQAKYGYNG